MRKNVSIYSDGACSGNPGAGGWAAILMYKDVKREISGYVRETTNNRMELFSIIQAFTLLKEPCRVKVYSDSAYVIDAFNKGWLDSWKKNKWLNSQKDPVKNQDLWNDLLGKIFPHEVEWIKVKGHSDNEFNNRCDALAVAEIKNAARV